MRVLSDFDYPKNEDALDTILYDVSPLRTGQNWIHLSPISEVKICVEQSMYNRCGIYSSFQNAFLCSVITKNALDKFAIHLRSREIKILVHFLLILFGLSVVVVYVVFYVVCVFVGLNVCLFVSIIVWK